jgi:hypothetical protein
MKLDDKDLGVVHMALGLYKSSIDLTLEKGGLSVSEEALLEDISIQVEATLQKVGRRFVK